MNEERYLTFLSSIKENPEQAKTLVHILGETMSKMQKKQKLGHTYYEMTVTIAPKKKATWCKLIHKEIYNMEPEDQYDVLKWYILSQSKKRQIDIIGVPEFHANGNIHFHCVLRHKNNYEIHLRKLQRQLQRKIGNTKMTELTEEKNLIRYFGYMLKDINKTGLQPIIQITDNTISKAEITSRDKQRSKKAYYDFVKRLDKTTYDNESVFDVLEQ